MSSKSTSKKKAASGAESTVTNNAVAKKIKVPKCFIVRPHGVETPKTIANVYLHPEIFNALEFRNGQLVHICPLYGKPGLIATVLPSNDITTENVISVSQSFRNLGGFILGDRIEISKCEWQPKYAYDVLVYVGGGGGCGGDDDDDDDNNSISIKRLLEDVGLIYPGLKIQESGKKEVIVCDADITIDSQVNSLSIKDTTENVSSTVSPPYLFTSQTLVERTTTETSPSRSKFPNLPRRLTYFEIGGLCKQIETLKSTIELPLHTPTLFSDFGISPPRGILLHGPSGETESALRNIFEEAFKFQPSIIIMDEIDSLAPSRTSDDTGETENRVVATLLTMMDSIGDNGQVVVVGATNRPNSVDISLRRPGRFDQEIEIGIPDADSRQDILQKQFEKMNKNKYALTTEQIAAVASKTHGYVGADLVALCREAVIKAINRGLATQTPQQEIAVTFDDLNEALTEIRPSAMREIFLETPKIYWSDIGGQEDLKRKLIEVVQLPLEAAASFSALGINAPKGVLLYGPPGCSKTLTAKALATESGLNFLAVKGPEIFNKYVGESERTIREIFRKAKSASPSIIFLDEIDAIAGDRDGDGTSASKNVLTSLLNEIDGIEELKGVVIIGATNKPSQIDPALLRPGRLDRHIYVGPPDLEARLQILQNCCRKFNLVDVDLELYARLSAGCSGAEVTLLCQEAGLNAIMENRNTKHVEDRHFSNALKGIARNITSEMLEYYKDFSKKAGLDK
ncbi:AFG2 [Candida oxycetoniae]|uniref:AFG2 n=1 Tax=Candida oxycetoniae TaxID=497107 RepID=A0AAI9ST94_9ASCO|nr:AFG2 [Candida oxycetoniae]KAI3402297.2 AFG2 [Candida oxycetoniae]